MDLIPSTFKQLRMEHKEAVGLLSMGTFLEYFDIQLYVHMAVLLNEIFFPKSDPHVTKLVAAFAFCSTYFFRPLGALLFGWLGDQIGRKTTVVITIFIMAVSCLIIAIMPTYAQIGITASVILTIVRIIQGMACTGESTGSEIYLTETTKPPIQYTLVSMMTVFTAVGTMAALGIATLVISLNLNWRLVFLFGASIALIGSVARTALKETPEFADARRRLKKTFNNSNKDQSLLQDHYIIESAKVNKKTMAAYFLMNCTRPICFYFAYIHCGNILRETLHFTSAQVIAHNFIISIIDLFGLIVLALMSYKIYPLKILKFKLVAFTLFLLGSPYLLSCISSPLHVGLIQTFAIFFAFDEVPGGSILYKYFPVFKRFTYSSILHAIARAFMYPMVSFGLVYLTEYFGGSALLIISLPLSVGYLYGLLHFEKLEQQATGHFHHELKIDGTDHYKTI